MTPLGGEWRYKFVLVVSPADGGPDFTVTYVSTTTVCPKGVVVVPFN
jgi:hypothetical protein